MSRVDDSEVIVFKRMSQDIIKNLTPIATKLRVKIKKGVHCFYAIKEKFVSSESIEEVEFYSKKMREWQSAINKSFAVLDRVETIIKRNEERFKYLQEKCTEMGIYNDKVEPKTLQEKIKPELNNLTKENLNLDQNVRGAGISKFVYEEVMVFKNGRIDFSDKENLATLPYLSQEQISKFIGKYPYIVGEFPDEVFLNSDLKNKILKECIVFAGNNIRNNTLKDVNAMLGVPLANAGELKSIEQFAEELKNLFNYLAKEKLKELLPDKLDEITEKLSCNEKSEFLPRSKVEAVLAGGMAGKTETVTEEKESEEERKEREKEDRLMLELDNLLSELMEESQEEREEAQEAAQEDVQKAEKVHEEQQKEAKELEQELEQELEKILRKDDFDE